jgi:hypothetical protein
VVLALHSCRKAPPHRAAQHHRTAQHRIIAPHRTAQHGAARRSTARHGAAQRSTARHRIALRGQVSLFGLTDDPCRPFHYYGPPKPQCTAAIPAENDEPLHWFAREHAIYRRWQREGLLQIYS